MNGELEKDMSCSTSKKRVVIALPDIEYVVVPEEAWDEIRRKATWVIHLQGCRTWGEYRQLGMHPFEDEVREAFCRSGVPPDDELFPRFLPFIHGDAGWDQFTALEVATKDFFDSLVESVHWGEIVGSDDQSGWVAEEHIEQVVRKLTDLGFVVANGHFDDW
jgi:hypothetical protein